MEKLSGRFKELKTIGISSDESEIARLVQDGYEWIDREEQRRHPRLDLFDEERARMEDEVAKTERMPDQRHGPDPRPRLRPRGLQPHRGQGVPPASEGAPVLSCEQGGYGCEYLKNHFDEEIEIKLPLNKDVIRKTMIMERH